MFRRNAQPRAVVECRNGRGPEEFALFVRSTDKPVGDAGLESRLKDLYLRGDESRKERDFKHAMELFDMVLQRAPEGTLYEVKASEKWRECRRQLGMTFRQNPKKKKVINRDAHFNAFKQFEEHKDDYTRRLATLQASDVVTQIEDTLTQMLPDTPERTEVELYLRRAGYIKELAERIRDRLARMPTDKARWHNFDWEADEGWLLVDAEPEGLRLQSEGGSARQLKPWDSLSQAVFVKFLDALVDRHSPSENLWAGHLCQLAGAEDAAASFFLNVRVLEPSKTISKELAELEK